MKVLTLVAKLTPKNVTGAVERGTKQRIMRAGLVVMREAKELCSKGGGKDHVPSKPGDPPHVQTGVLRSSIKVEWDGERRVVVGPSVAYGRHLEFGTRKVAARPFMRPALMRVLARLPKLFQGLMTGGA
jgi:HK97 gp10 family phage protein